MTVINNIYIQVNIVSIILYMYPTFVFVSDRFIISLGFMFLSMSLFIRSVVVFP